MRRRTSTKATRSWPGPFNGAAAVVCIFCWSSLCSASVCCSWIGTSESTGPECNRGPGITCNYESRYWCGRKLGPVLFNSEIGWQKLMYSFQLVDHNRLISEEEVLEEVCALLDQAVRCPCGDTLWSIVLAEAEGAMFCVQRNLDLGRGRGIIMPSMETANWASAMPVQEHWGCRMSWKPSWGCTLKVLMPRSRSSLDAIFWQLDELSVEWPGRVDDHQVRRLPALCDHLDLKEGTVVLVCSEQLNSLRFSQLLVSRNVTHAI